MNANPNPWDRPAPLAEDTLPHATAEELYSAIGKAISDWSKVESDLCMLFIGLYSGGNGYVAYRVYGALPSTAARITALKVSAEAAFAEKPEHAAYAKAVLALVEKFLGRRNDIAHGFLALRVKERRASLMEPHFNVKHADKNGGYEFEARDVLGYAEQFRYLSRELDHAFYLLKTPVRKGFGARPGEGTPLTKYVEPYRTALAKRKSGLGLKRTARHS